MNRTYEHDIIQNSVIAGILMRTFCHSFYESTNNEHGPVLPLVMPVLPIVFNKHITSKLYSRQMNGGLLKAVAEDKTLFAGLQHNIGAMKEQTFEAISFCCATGFLLYDSDTAELIPLKVRGFSLNRIKEMLNFSGIQEMLATAKRLGYWFSVLRREQLLSIMGIMY